MLGALVEFSVRFRGVVIALGCVVAGYGLYVAAHARFDVFPEFAPPLIVVQTEAPGLSPEEVEALVTRPIENAVQGSGPLDSLRSQSVQGLSVVTAIFRAGSDIFHVRQLVGERLVMAARALPQGVGAPTLAPLTSSTSRVLVIGLTSAERSPMELHTVAEWVLRPRLLGVPGVANVSVFGGERRQLQVQVRPERLLAHDLTVQDVLAAARGATGVRGAGFVETAAQRIVLHTEGQSVTAAELGRAVLAEHGGVSVRLMDVADVVDGPEPKIGDATIMGTPGVLLVVSSQLGTNTLEVTDAIESALSELQPTLDAERITVHPALFRPANFIGTAIHNVTVSLLIGGVLVMGVLFLFLMNVRTAFISCTAIPLSLLMAVIGLDRLGFTLNTLSLGGLAIAIGEVVDDAIIDAENIVRRLRANRASSAPRPTAAVVLDASLEVRSAVIYATFVVVVVFLPVLTMSGLQGRLFAPLGIAYILAVLASLLVALTLTPALSMSLLADGKREMREPGYVAGLRRRYERLLERIAGRSREVLVAVAALCVLAVLTLPFFGGAFLPEFREGHFIVHMAMAPGTSIDESVRFGQVVTHDLLQNPHIRSVAQQIGRAEQADDTWGTHYSELHVDVAPLGAEEAEDVQSEIRDTLARFPGAYFAIKPFLTERIEETISGVTAEVVVRIFGDDLDVIDQKAAEVAAVLVGIDGATDVQLQSPPGAPRLVVRLRRDRLQQFGFQPAEVLDAVQTAYQGAVAAQLYEGNRVFDVAVLLDPALRREPESVGALLVSNRAGMRLPLRELATVYMSTGRYAVLHDGARRQQAVSCNVAGRDLASFVADAKRQVAANVTLPAGTYAVFSGAAEAQSQAQRELAFHAVLAAAGIVLLLAVVFRRVRNLLLVLANVPFALVGGVLAVFITGGWLSLGSLVGFVTLFGITMRNSIMLVSHFEHLVTVEGQRWEPATAWRGASERLVPILMTALVTGLGLLPLAIGSGTPGREIEGPMAIVILGGLLTSTALNLLVLPTLALRFAHFAPADVDA